MSKVIFLLLACVISLTGCGSVNVPSVTQSPSPVQTESPPGTESKKISAAEAKNMMAESDNYILLDVRTEEEFREKRIKSAVLIPDYEITDRAKAELPDKKALILLYC